MSSRRGRRLAGSENALTKDRIVQAALALLDERGLASFSVRDVAKALDAYPAAVYWHVRNRNQLLAEIVAHVLRDIAPDVPARHWQHWLREMFGRYRATVRRHPNVAPLIGAQLVSNASLDFDLIERLLQVLSSAGFTGAHLVAAFDVVIAAQVGFVTLEFAPVPEDGETWANGMQASIQSVDGARHPLLAANLNRMANRSFMLRWQSGTEIAMDGSYRAYIDTVIAGLEAMATRLTKAKPA